MGAWDVIYQEGTRGDAGSAVGYACEAIKRELKWLGFFDLDPATPVIGARAAAQIRRFQEAHALAADAQVGPITAKALFLQRTRRIERKCSIANRFVCRITSLESSFDPGAVGVSDQHDHGLVQINALAHPTVTLAEAFDPAFALNYLGEALQTMFLKLGDWDGAVAAWNVGGGGASDWVGMGKPSTGGPWWFPNLFQRATEYVELVEAQPC